jgi:hypothetical protein
MAGKAFMPLMTLLGFVMPAKTTGRMYLEQELAGYGIPRGTLPKACLQALTDKMIDQAKAISTLTRTSRPWRFDLVPLLDALAWGVASILKPENNKWGTEIIGEAALRHLLLGFDVDLPPRPTTWRGPF